MLCGLVLHAQQQYVVHLQVVDAQNDEPVADADITIDVLDRTFATNEYGKVTVLLPLSYYTFKVSSLGIISRSFQATIDRDTTLTFPVTVEAKVLDEVEVVDARFNEKVDLNVVGVEKISLQAIEALPMLAGEKDIVKSLTLLPGVQTGTEGSANINVRGGTSDQNLYLLDHATLYHSGHLLGFLSSFNPMAIDSVTLFKAGFPARYGGRLSSVIQTGTKEGNLDSVSVRGNVGIISSKLSVQVPVIRQKSSLILSGRRTYVDLFQRLFAGSNPVRNQTSYVFYDMNAKWVYYFTPDNKVSINFYQDYDTYYDITTDRTTEPKTYQENRLTWRNRIIEANWDARLSAKLHHNLSLSQTSYAMQILDDRQGQKQGQNYRNAFNTSLQDLSLKENMHIQVMPSFQADVGVQYEHHRFNPALLSSRQADTTFSENTLPETTAQQLSLYVEGYVNFSDRYSLSAGIRNSHYFVDQHNYLNRAADRLEPRVNVERKLGAYSAVRASYARMVQPIHLLTDPGLGLPFNLWVSSNQQVKPQKADQVAGGYYTSFLLGKRNYSLSVEGYYKWMYDIVAYRDGFSSSTFTTAASNTDRTWDKVLTSGNGKSYGAEVLLEKTSGAFTGWLAYTLSWTKHQFADLNYGRPFYSRYDRRHDLSLVGFYKLNKKWDINFNFSYATGQPVTLPLYTYPGFTFNYDQGKVTNTGVLLYTQGGRNAYRMKAFHRLDIAFQSRLQWRNVQGSVEFGLFNLYNRKNPYYYYADTDYVGNIDRPKRVSVIKSVSLFPMIPSVSLSFEF